MRARAYWALQVVGALTLAAPPAFAQEPAQTDNDAVVAQAPLTPEESAILGNALVFDAAALATPPKKPFRVPGSSDPGYDVSRTQNLDGSSSVVVKQPLQTEWSNSVGGNLGPSNSGGSGAVGQPLPTTRGDTPSGAAWASLGVPNIGSIDARIDPSGEQGKVGTTLKQSIPFGGRFAVTLQGTYSVTETLGQPSGGPSDIPLMTLPSAPAGAASQVFGNERSV